MDRRDSQNIDIHTTETGSNITVALRFRFLRVTGAKMSWRSSVPA